jgi:hypothetical protein
MEIAFYAGVRSLFNVQNIAAQSAISDEAGAVLIGNIYQECADKEGDLMNRLYNFRRLS